MHTAITTRLEADYRHCNSPRRRTRLMTRWAPIPALSGLTPTGIVNACEAATFDQNPIVEALIRLHQDGDEDATTVLMTALRPIVIGAIRRRGSVVSHDVLDNDWAAVAHTLATIDPGQPPADSEGRPLLYLNYLGNRISHSRRKIDPATRRWLVRRQRDAAVTQTLIDADLASDDSDLRQCSTTATCVEDHAIARVELDRIARAVATGQLPRSRWEQLVDHRITSDRDTVASGRTRVAVHRTANRLALLVDHAA